MVFVILLLSVVLVSASGDHQVAIKEGKKLVESKVKCENLTDKQLESIGEYLMEQMHPGEVHETMHKRMGLEEGTETHKQFHVNIARNMYCNQTGMMGGNMMNGNMMGGNATSGIMGGMSNSGMMGNFAYGFGYSSILWLLFLILIIIALILLIIWFYRKITGATTNNDSALEILKNRYAKGEITKKQFEEMKKVIGV